MFISYLQAIKYLERMLEQAHCEKELRNKQNNNGDSNNADSDDQKKEVFVDNSIDGLEHYSKEINIDPKTYCKLGHFHLLLEDYAKGIFIFKFVI